MDRMRGEGWNSWLITVKKLWNKDWVLVLLVETSSLQEKPGFKKNTFSKLKHHVCFKKPHLLSIV